MVMRNMWSILADYKKLDEKEYYSVMWKLILMLITPSIILGIILGIELGMLI